MIVTGFMCAALPTCGCGHKVSHVEQIRRGVQDVDRHAKEIQREAQGPAEPLSPGIGAEGMA